MKFKFCGDLDAPDFLLKEIDTLSKISVVRIKLIVAQVVKGILGEQIDFAKVENLLSKSNLSTGDVKGSVAGIDFILKSGCKYNVDDETLSLELNQLGLPKEHCEAFSKVYSQKKDALQTKLKSETLKLTRLDSSKPVDWRVDYVLASSAKSKIDAAVANVQLNLTTPNGEQQTIAFEADQAQFRVLLSELRDAQAVMESVVAP